MSENVLHVKELHPTHSCFDDVGDIWRIVIEPLIAKGENVHETVKIVHGIVPRKKGKKAYSHAWVEHRNDVLECKHVNSKDGPKAVITLSKRDYYREKKITDFIAYSLREFALLQLQHGHTGPYVNRYYELCRDPEYRPAPEGACP